MKKYILFWLKFLYFTKCKCSLFFLTYKTMFKVVEIILSTVNKVFNQLTHRLPYLSQETVPYYIKKSPADRSKNQFGP